MSKIGLVLQVPTARVRFLRSFEDVLRRETRLFKNFELFLLYDGGKPQSVPDSFLTGMDRTELTIAGVKEENPFHRNVNVLAGYLVRERPDVTHMLITHPECLLFRVFPEALRLSDDRMICFPTVKTEPEAYVSLEPFDLTTAEFDDLKDLPGVHPFATAHWEQGEAWWWFCVLIPVEGYWAVGGVDERMFRYPLGGDDQFGRVWQNSGRKIAFTNRAAALHLWHRESANPDIEPRLLRGWDIANEYRDAPRLRFSNPGIDWIHPESILSAQYIPAEERRYAAV